MNTKKVASYVKEFMAIMQGDNAQVTAEKNFRTSVSALKTHVHIMDGKTVEKEDAVSEAKDALKMARYNSGNLLKSDDRDQYVRTLISAKNALVQAEESLEEHLSTLEFLKEQLALIEE